MSTIDDDIPAAAVAAAALIADSKGFGLFPGFMQGVEGRVWVLGVADEGEDVDTVTPVAVLLIGNMEFAITPDPSVSSEVDSTFTQEGQSP